MADLDVGGGGGRVREVDEQSLYGLDQPYEIQGAFTSEMARQINEMFDFLFKGQRRSEDGIDVLKRAEASGLIMSDVAISNAQIGTMNTVPVVQIVGVPLKIIVPQLWFIETETTVVYTSTPNFRLRPDGVSVDYFVVNGFSMRLNELRHDVHMDTAAPTDFAAGGDLVGLDVELDLSANPTGAGDATSQSLVGYLLVESKFA